MAEVIERARLRAVGTSREFEGYEHGDVGVTFILVNGAPGSGPRLHRHPYAEVFVIQEGQATFTVDGRTLEATAGQVVVVQPGEAHRFVNSGSGPLRQIDIHASPRFITEWLEVAADEALPVAEDARRA
ncbi:MAG TPA: cupin domain-containing protein [Thermomicrobiaceae bacterium]|nr:cupin domain-containing protein [Thermomicrobiaceae bacterium]